MRFDGDRNTDQPVAEYVEAGGFGVETEFTDGGEPVAQRFERLLRFDDVVGVRDGVDRFVGVCAEQVGLSGTPACRLFERREQVRSPGRLGSGRRNAGFGPRGFAVRRNAGVGMSLPHLLQQRAKTQFLENLGQTVGVRRFHDHFFGFESHRNVLFDGRQPFGQQDLFAQSFDILPLFAGEFFGIVEQVLDRTVLADQLHGALLADARHARDVVRGIAPQRENVDYLFRVVDAVVLADLFAADDFDSFVAAFALFVDIDVRTDQLAIVLVRRDHEHFESGFGRFARQRADHVVGFVSGDFDHRDSHRFEELLNVRNRDDDVLRRFAAVGFVVGEQFVPEIAARRIERHAKVVRVFAANDLVDVADEAENSRGVDAVGVPHRTTNECVIESEYQRVSVDQE